MAYDPNCLCDDYPGAQPVFCPIHSTAYAQTTHDSQYSGSTRRERVGSTRSHRTHREEDTLSGSTAVDGTLRGRPRQPHGNNRSYVRSDSEDSRRSITPPPTDGEQCKQRKEDRLHYKTYNEQDRGKTRVCFRTPT